MSDNENEDRKNIWPLLILVALFLGMTIWVMGAGGFIIAVLCTVALFWYLNNK